MGKKLGAVLFVLGFFALGQAQILTLDEAVSGQVLGIQSINVKLDEILSDLLAIGGASTEKGVNLLSENITYGRVRENIMFGGYNAAFLLGYNPVFLSLGFKALFR